MARPERLLRAAGALGLLLVAGPASGIAQQDSPQAASAPSAPVIRLDDLSNPTELEHRLTLLGANSPKAEISVYGGSARRGDVSIGPDQQVTGPLLVMGGNADVYGTLVGNLVTVDGNIVVHPGAVISGDVLALQGQVRQLGGEIGGEVRALSRTMTTPAPTPPSTIGRIGRDIAGVVGVFFTLTVLGIGLVIFGRHNLEVVSDTVLHSFGRSFLTGLVGQLLLVPTFGMLVVGLTLTVVGVLLVPFGILIYGLLALVAIVGGLLAVAHAMGETYTRRRMAQGVLASPNAFRYVLLGLAGIFVLWGAWAVFGWVPVAGPLVGGAAVLVSWLLVTAGFGAALLSRAGIRENFAGRILPPEALTDEYLWATPQFGVAAVQRPTSRPPHSGS
jgi:hypothetical protein